MFQSPFIFFSSVRFAFLSQQIMISVVWCFLSSTVLFACFFLYTFHYTISIDQRMECVQWRFPFDIQMQIIKHAILCSICWFKWCANQSMRSHFKIPTATEQKCISVYDRNIMNVRVTHDKKNWNRKEKKKKKQLNWRSSAIVWI